MNHPPWAPCEASWRAYSFTALLATVRAPMLLSMPAANTVFTPVPTAFPASAPASAPYLKMHQGTTSQSPSTEHIQQRSPLSLRAHKHCTTLTCAERLFELPSSDTVQDSQQHSPKQCEGYQNLWGNTMKQQYRLSRRKGGHFAAWKEDKPLSPPWATSKQSSRIELPSLPFWVTDLGSSLSDPLLAWGAKRRQRAAVPCPSFTTAKSRRESIEDCIEKECNRKELHSPTNEETLTAVPVAQAAISIPFWVLGPMCVGFSSGLSCFCKELEPFCSQTSAFSAPLLTPFANHEATACSRNTCIFISPDNNCNKQIKGKTDPKWKKEYIFSETCFYYSWPS